MEISGVMVFVNPAQWSGALEQVAALPGVSTHQSDAAAGKLVVTIESRTVDEQKTLLRKVQDVPGVRTAELAYHYNEDEEAGSV